ncbi:MAG: glycine--tRNA ligase [Chloroflexi bacterium]|nr:glycine--tRNA ligase [Chloroflexota bacterium]
MIDMDTLVSLCKRRGFIFQSSEIYGGIGGFWDYGPLGVELKNNIKRAWWKAVVQDREDMVGIDTAIIMNPNVWRASGHVAEFSDPLVECKTCHFRFRADMLKSENCPNCGNKTLMEPRQFNMLFRTFVGSVEDDAAVAYLRPETAQGIFVNFKNVQDTTRKKIPFGIAQIGRAFRNEIVTGNFIFRDREFDQMEIEYFVKPGAEDEWHARWRDDRMNWWKNALGIRAENLRVRALDKKDLAHYSKGTFEIEYQFPMGWSEVEGIASRTDYDLKRHSEASGKSLEYFDDETKEHFLPYVIEPSMGIERCFLVVLFDAYQEEQVRASARTPLSKSDSGENVEGERAREEKRVALKLSHALAPIKAAILPLARNRAEIVELARKLTADLKPMMPALYDDSASIGRLYRRQDEIGTPFCVTVDHQSAIASDEKYDGKVTIRDRDSMEQVRVSVDQVKQVLIEKLGA